MTGKQLKNSILQWAIQGKLVPQDPNDEPASVLLEKIRAEKARLIKEGKIKKDKKESIIYRGEDNSHYEKFADGKVVCIDDEIPFEIPSSWEWCRLGGLVDFSKSKSVKANSIDSTAWLLDLEDIEKDTGKLLHKKRMGTTTSISDKHRFERGNVLYSKLRPYLNKVIIADEDGYCTSEILCFDFGMIYNKYAQLFLMSPFFVEYAMSDAYGVKMPRLGSKQGNNGLIPIPPGEEQKRIVNFINSLEPYIEKYSNAQASLDIINKEVKNTLKKSILQEAIQGKLVPQDPNDEPASILLQRIKEEKQRLVKKSKLKKKDVVDSVIFKGDDNRYYEQIGKGVTDITDEIPFDIPDSWIWARGKLIVLPMQSTKPVGEQFLYVDVDAVNNKKNVIDNAKVLLSANAPSRATRKLHLNDVLFSMVRPYLKNIALVTDTYANAIASTGFYVLSPATGVFSKYLFYMMLSPYVIDGLNAYMKGDNSPSINNVHIEEFLYPLPPFAEQKRIVNKIEEVFDRIKG